jgi:hypothetical protein
MYAWLLACMVGIRIVSSDLLSHTGYVRLACMVGIRRPIRRPIARPIARPIYLSIVYMHCIW